MKRFFLKIVHVFLFCVIAYTVSFGIMHLLTKANCVSNIYVWGDSQMVQGIDNVGLSQNLGESVQSSAVHGSGVYDFLTFCNIVPDHSTVICSFPECALFRNPNSDANRSGVNIWALNQLYSSGYPLWRLNAISKVNNYRPKTKLLYKTQLPLYQYSDRISYSEPLSRFVDIFNRPNEMVDSKIAAYTKGVGYLKVKECRIVFVSFPFANELNDIISNSKCRRKSKILRNRIIHDYSCKFIEISLGKDTLLMHDLSHFNIIGANRLTNHVSEILNDSALAEKNLFINVGF